MAAIPKPSESADLSGAAVKAPTSGSTRSAQAALEGPSIAAEELALLRQSFRSGKRALIEHFEVSRPTAPSATRLIRGLARLVDQTLIGLWERAALPADAALLAVGGYGRGELFPHSDVDVLVLLPAKPRGTIGEQAQAMRSIEDFITGCWDIGLEIGSSVRTVEECMVEAERDVTVRTALLESRYLCGSRRGFNVFRRQNSQGMNARSFLRAKILEMRQRHQKFEDTPYSLEPNCKESPGGLRDLQVIIWVARAAGLGRNWSELAASGLATPFEVKQLQRNEGLVKLIRARLHLVAGRREDRLVFDLQAAVAESFGYRATNGQRASEVLMRRYYWAAKAVAQLNQILMLNIEERVNGLQDAPMRQISEHFLERDGMLEVASDDLYERHPHAILETFLTYQTTSEIQGLSARTLRALYNSRDLMGAEFRRDPVNRETFLRILKAPTGQTMPSG